MTQAMIDHYNYYQQKIQFLRSNGDILLQRIKILETIMNKRKQQNEYPFVQQINSLYAMVKKLFEILAEINTCQYFQLTFEPIYSPYFIEMCNRYFENLTRQFIMKLQMKREQRLRHLQNLSLEEILNRIDLDLNPIDFQIVQ